MKQYLEATDIILRKAVFEDWKSMYKNIWTSEESAKYMLWKPVQSEEEAKERMRKTIAHQAEHDAWLVYEKSSGEAIGFAGIIKIAENVYEDTGLALGKAYTGKGYGKQLLSLLISYVFEEKKAEKFVYSCRAENEVSKRLSRSLGFVYTHSEPRVDTRNGKNYICDFFVLKRETGK